MTSKTSRRIVRMIKDEESRKTEDREAGGSRRSRRSRMLEHPGAGGSEEDEHEKQE